MIQILLFVVLGALVVFVVRETRLLVRGGVDIRSRRTGRVLSVALLGSVLGVGVRLDYQRMRTGGREAFLAWQAHRFDAFISRQHSLPGDVLFAVVFVGVIVGAYEFVAWLFSLVLRPAKKNGAA